MNLYEVVLKDGGRSKARAEFVRDFGTALVFYDNEGKATASYRNADWLEYWQRQGVNE